MLSKKKTNKHPQIQYVMLEIIVEKAMKKKYFLQNDDCEKMKLPEKCKKTRKILY